MPTGATSIRYREIELARVEVIRPLWESLLGYHVALSPHFAVRRSARTFDARKQELLAKAATGKVKVDVAWAVGLAQPVAYCISSVASNGLGEIDSLFVDPEHRGKRIGTELTRRALEWLDDCGAVSKSVLVAFDNHPALDFYARFGFRGDYVGLRQV